MSNLYIFLEYCIFTNANRLMYYSKKKGTENYFIHLNIVISSLVK